LKIQVFWDVMKMLIDK